MEDMHKLSCLWFMIFAVDVAAKQNSMDDAILLPSPPSESPSLPPDSSYLTPEVSSSPVESPNSSSASPISSTETPDSSPPNSTYDV
jgi:hypothetical protein